MQRFSRFGRIELDQLLYGIEARKKDRIEHIKNIDVPEIRAEIECEIKACDSLIKEMFEELAKR